MIENQDLIRPSARICMPLKKLAYIIEDPKNRIRARDVRRVVHSVKFIVHGDVTVEDACRQLARWQPHLFFPDSAVFR